MPEYSVYQYNDCPPELFHFRYKIYVEELGRRQTYARHDTQTIEDPLDPTGYQGVAFNDGEIIGCVRLNFVRDGGVQPYYDFYELSQLPESDQMRASICTRYMVNPHFRKSRVPIELLKLIYLFGIENGANACYMDTNAPYIRFYQKFGYEALFEKNHPDYGRVTVMRLPVLDLGYLESVRSPFAPLCKRFLASQQKALAIA